MKTGISGASLQAPTAKKEDTGSRGPQGAAVPEDDKGCGGPPYAVMGEAQLIKGQAPAVVSYMIDHMDIPRRVLSLVSERF